jgi:hypothetical protein
MGSSAEYINVKDHGLYGDGSHDDTAALQALVNRTSPIYTAPCNLYLNGPFGVPLFFPPGGYLITAPIVIANAQTQFIGAGPQCSFIQHYPAVDIGENILFKFSKGTDSVLQHCGLSNLSIQSTDTSMVKTAIYLSDVDQMIIDNIVVFPYGDPVRGGTIDESIGLHILGRDLTTFKKISITCNRPIVVSPTGYIYNSCMDQMHFTDIYLSCPKETGTCVHFDPTVSISQVTFDGYQSWCGGYYGLYWNINDGLIPDRQYNIQTLIIKGVRVELNLQEDPLCPGYGVYLNGPAQNILLEDFQASTRANGYHFENTCNLTMTNCGYGWNYEGVGENPPSAEKVALHLHDDCDKVALINFDVQPPGIIETGTMVKGANYPGVFETYTKAT